MIINIHVQILRGACLLTCVHVTPGPHIIIGPSQPRSRSAYYFHIRPIVRIIHPMVHPMFHPTVHSIVHPMVHPIVHPVHPIQERSRSCTPLTFSYSRSPRAYPAPLPSLIPAARERIPAPLPSLIPAARVRIPAPLPSLIPAARERIPAVRDHERPRRCGPRPPFSSLFFPCSPLPFPALRRATPDHRQLTPDHRRLTPDHRRLTPDHRRHLSGP